MTSVGTSTPVKVDDPSKKRELSSPFNDDMDNPEKKNKPGDMSADISDIDQSPAVHLADTDFDKIAFMIKGAISSEVEPLVKSIVEGVTSSLNKKIETLENDNACLNAKVKALTSRVETLELAADTAEQYSRRNCVRIVGVQSSPSENTDDIVLKIASACNADIKPTDIDRSHRVGKTPTWTKPRAIIVKFATYRARDRFFRGRSNLKDNNTYRKVYINEDLTANRNSLFQKARQLVKDKDLKQAWTFDGRIYVKTDDDVRHVIIKPSDLDKYET